METLAEQSVNPANTGGSTPVRRVEARIDPSWKTHLDGIFQSDSFWALKQFLQAERQQGKVMYPKGRDIFRAFDLTPFDAVRVVILGQDPYHGPGQAHGLAFSVPDGVPIPPSLRHIFQEMQQDVGCSYPASGDLSHLARQGVLLLNTVLTVEQGKAHAHQGKGWEILTDAAIRALGEYRHHLVFMLWGQAAIQKKRLIPQDNHLVLTAPHPSPLSAHRGFLGCQHFSAANRYLESQGYAPIDWCGDPTCSEPARASVSGI